MSRNTDVLKSGKLCRFTDFHACLKEFAPSYLVWMFGGFLILGNIDIKKS